MKITALGKKQKVKACSRCDLLAEVMIPSATILRLAIDGTKFTATTTRLCACCFAERILNINLTLEQKQALKIDANPDIYQPTF